MTDIAELAGISDSLPWPDYDAATRANDALVTSGDLGQLAGLVEWLAGAQAQFPVRAIERARLVLAVTDHPIAATGVSRLSADDTARQLQSITQGSAPLAELAARGGVGIRVEAVPAGTAIEAAIKQGVAAADAEIDAGADLIVVGNIGAGSTTVAAILISVLAGTEPAKVVGRGGRAIDDLAWMHKVAAVRDGRRQAWRHRRDPIELLAAVGGSDLALLAGLLLRAAARRTPVLLDGVVTVAAALLADSAQAGARRWWRPAQLTGEPALAIALGVMHAEPILDLAIAAGDGRGGLLALEVLRSAALLSRPGSGGSGDSANV